MSSWSLILALSGFRWDATAGALAFASMVSENDFRCFFSTGSGWGTFEQRRGGGAYTALITLHGGDLALRTLQAPLADGSRADATVDGSPVEARAVPGGIAFTQPLTLQPNQRLRVSARFAP